jgi:hypothetical protein
MSLKPSPDRYVAVTARIEQQRGAATNISGNTTGPTNRDLEAQRARPRGVPKRDKISTAKLAALWNSGYRGALWTDMSTRGGDGAAETPAGKMIEQRHSEMRPDSRRKSDPSLDEARLRQQAIGVKLRQMFDQVVNEPVPEEFLEILKRADARKPGQD